MCVVVLGNKTGSCQLPELYADSLKLLHNKSLVQEYKDSVDA